MTSRLPRWRPADASAKVQESPPTYAVVVTQFVTHQPGSRLSRRPQERSPVPLRPLGYE